MQKLVGISFSGFTCKFELFYTLSSQTTINSYRHDCLHTIHCYSFKIAHNYGNSLNYMTCML